MSQNIAFSSVFGVQLIWAQTFTAETDFLKIKVILAVLSANNRTKVEYKCQQILL